MRLAVMWPRPRGHRWRLGQDCPAENPDQSDALLFLEEFGFRVSIEDSCGLPWNPLCRMHELWSGLDPARTLRLVSRLRRYDLVIGVGDATMLPLVQLRRLLKFRLPIVAIDPALSYHYPRRKRIQDSVLPRVQKVFVFGKAQLAYLEEQYGNRVDAVMLHHRLDTDFFCPAPAAKRGQPPSATSAGPTLVSVGIDRSRDFETLAKAVQLCRANGLPGLRCVIRTPHDVEIDQPGLEVLHEQVSWTQLREAYRQANVVVLPLFDSLHPGGINTLLEAMAIGRPVVLSDSRGIRDYVCDRETARVVEPGSPAMLAAAIGELLADRDAAAAMGMRARAWVEKHCRSRVYAEALARHLRDAYVKVFPAKPLPADQTRNVSAPCPDECETLT